VSLLQRLSNRVVLALDSDRAGIAAVKRAADLMLARGIDLKVAKLPDGKDPADIIAEDVTVFKKMIGQATHVIEFLLDVLATEVADERAFKLRARDEVLPFLLRMDSQIDKEHFVGVIAERLSTTKDAIMLELARLEAAAEDRPTALETEAPAAPAEQPALVRKESVLSYLIVASDIVEKNIGERTLELLTEISGASVETLRQSCPPETMSSLLFTLEDRFADTPQKQIDAELVGGLKELEKIMHKEALREHKESLQRAESEGDEAATTAAVMAISALQQKLTASIVPESLLT